MISDADLLALNAFEEANLEPDDGLAAVVRVVLNRAKLLYQSDGTIRGTILHPNAFSWTAWQMVNGHYTRVAFTPEEVDARVADLLARTDFYKTAWARAQRIAAAVQAGTYHGPLYDKITDAVVLYLNPLIVPHLPAWADPDNEVVRIAHHTFYRAA